MKATPVICGECLIPVSECCHKLYILDELLTFGSKPEVVVRLI